MGSPLHPLKSTLVRVCAPLVVAACALGVLPAHAGVWTESGDAGQTVGSAQNTGVSVPLNQIVGSLSSTTDADLYLINIVDPSQFLATTVGSSDDFFDTQLFLFTADGAPVYMNDDADGFTFLSTLPAGASKGPVAPGIYILAVAMLGYDPINENGQLLFEAGLSTDVRGPASGLQPGLLGGFTDNVAGEGGAYSITLRGANGVPEPSTALLAALAAGLGAWGARSRRRGAKAA